MYYGVVLGISLLSLVASIPTSPAKQYSGPLASDVRYKNDRAVGHISEASRNLTVDLYKAIRSTEGASKNLVFSPWSISMGLAMLLNGANENTALQLYSALKFRSFFLPIYTINNGFKNLLYNMKSKNYDYELETANAIYTQIGFPVKPEFTMTVSEFYKAPVQNLDFELHTEASRHTINNLVATKTRNLTREFIPPGALDPKTLLYILNAIYFSGTWISQFPVSETKPAPFHIDRNSVVTVDMMQQKSDLRAAFIKDLDSYAVELPYKGNRLSMVIILPKSINGLSSLERKVTPDKLYTVLYDIVHRAVTLSMPRFKVEERVNLEPVLNKMGVTDVFGNAADLTNMDATSQLHVSTAVHQAVLEVDEKGAKAAAATGVGLTPLSLFFKEPPPPLIIKVDHPFMFYIYDWDTRIVLFAGSIINPTSQVPTQQKTPPPAPQENHEIPLSNIDNPFSNLKPANSFNIPNPVNPFSHLTSRQASGDIDHAASTSNFYDRIFFPPGPVNVEQRR